MAKKIVVAIDGSKNSMHSLDYISALFGAESDLEINLLYVMPSLPPLFDDPKIRRQAKQQIAAIEKKNKEYADNILTIASDHLKEKGLSEKKIQSYVEVKNIGPARDVCHFAAKKRASAIFVGARGRSRLEAFFTGTVSGNIIQYSKSCPVWVINGKVKSKKVLIPIDASDNSLRTVDHIGLLLTGTQASVTLFHTKRDLRRFMPKVVIDASPGLEGFWQEKAGEQIDPFLKKAFNSLVETGIDDNRISTKILRGTRNPAGDIVKYASENGFGTIAMGRHGQSDKKEYAMGSLTGKVLQSASNMAVCIC